MHVSKKKVKTFLWPNLNDKRLTYSQTNEWTIVQILGNQNYFLQDLGTFYVLFTQYERFERGTYIIEIGNTGVMVSNSVESSDFNGNIV
jgi:hypothetical protein